MSNLQANGALRGRRVLVVEDEYFIADDVAKALRTLGAEVVGPVPTREEALAIISGQEVHLAVLDINLQDQMVYPVADALRDRGVPFVFATGYDARAVAEGYLDVPRWEKPFEPDKLAGALAGLF